MTLKVMTNDTAGHGFCGPIAVACMTGKKLSKVLDAFRIARHGKDWRRKFYRPPLIKGTTSTEVIEAMRILGYKLWTSAQCQKPTLAQWARSRTPEIRKRPVLVNLRHHWVTVKGNRFADTKTHGKPVALKDAPYRRSRVHRIYVFEKIGAGVEVKPAVLIDKPTTITHYVVEGMNRYGRWGSIATYVTFEEAKARAEQALAGTGPYDRDANLNKVRVRRKEMTEVWIKELA